MVQQGRFITIEGGEGVGKSLFGKNLAIELGKLGKDLLTTREPGGTPSADRIRRIFASPPDEDPLLMTTEAFLVSAARAQHVGAKIKPALAAGRWVLSDRFADSTRVYQGSLGGINAVVLEQLIMASTGGLEPDLTFLLDCDVEVSIERIKGRGQGNGGDDGASRYDDAREGFHRQLRKSYLELAARFVDRMVVIDAARTPEAMVADAMAAVRERLNDQS